MTDPLFWHRLQFGFTVTFHYIFPQLTMGLALLIVVLKAAALRTGNDDWNTAARFWIRIFGLSFAMGVATGVPMEFQFGTNWAVFSSRAGGVIGQTLAMEGIFAFFLESSFLAVLLYGERRLGPRTHFIAALALWIGSWLSGYFIIVTNAFMQYPTGYTVAADGSFQVARLAEYVFNPWAVMQYLHNQVAATVTGAFVMAAVGAYWTLRREHTSAARVSLRVGVIAGLVSAMLVAFPTGHFEGRLVAEHFLARGFRSLVYYSDAPNWVYEERGQGFVETLAKAGRKCTWLRWHRSPARRTGRDAWRRKRAWLAAKMQRARKPVAVFAAADGHAMDILEACKSAGLKVPDEVAIVGAGDTLLAPDAMSIPISTVDTGIETLGFMGAELLDQLMGGASVPKEPVRLPPVGLMARKSSDAMAVPHDKVARCLRFIWEHCQEPIGVDDLVKVAAMSRRGLHQAFVEHVGRPPGAELQRVRIERSKHLLAASDDKLETVAGLCGYRRANSFWLAFKHATGVSPQQYRQQVRR